MLSTSRKTLRLAGCAALALGFLSSGAEAGNFKVELNEQKVLHLAAPIATVMVGNPAIADVLVENSQTVYVLGRSYGKTNFIALDAAGKQIVQYDLDVVAQSGGVVTLVRGTGQATYSCSPRCEPVLNPSDSGESFSKTLNQSSALAGAASGAATSASAAQTPQ
ncbi:pilus assembly protein CpaC [Parvibaculum sedimenti]|uniref:Pilus assembly protein CpaC n=1 Tax=Parvibaculum sedimenti TaxID=2608632 RepID=A0A6N6VMA6_9HYPH|nr:pilus assembly protein N-terminal domain-containing protein [Parvibaculum sedimenti]KAB7742833.1 pilus assembly protein CpaC [Parvibaculum sedimenti]